MSPVISGIAYRINNKDSLKKKKKASNGSLAYDLLSLINLQVKCNLPILRYNTDILMNFLGIKKKKKKKKRICTLHYSVAIWLNHFVI